MDCFAVLVRQLSDKGRVHCNLGRVRYQFLVRQLSDKKHENVHNIWRSEEKVVPSYQYTFSNTNNMALYNYDYMIATNPPGSRNEGSDEALGHHVRLMPSATITGRQLVEKMRQMEPVLSRGVCHSALDALARALEDLLADGHPINIPGIGSFQPRLTGDVVRGARGLAAQHVRIGSVQFTADAELLMGANRGQGKLRRRGSSALPTEEQVSLFLNEHFATHATLTRKVVIKHFGITKYQALMLLQNLIDKHVIVRRGSRATAHYEKA